MDETSHAPNGSLKNMEFTPVGFIKSKQNSTQTQIVSPTKVPNYNDDDENEGPARKMRRISIDDTIDSTRLFSEASQFDDSFPEIKANIPPSSRSGNIDKNRKRNLIDDLKKDVPMSQPLKEQEVREHQLKKDRFERALESKLLGKRHITYAQSNLSDKELYINEIKTLRHEIKELRKEKNDSLNNYDNLEQEMDDLRNKLQELEKELAAKKKLVDSNKEEDHSACIEERERIEKKLNDSESKLKTMKGQVHELENSANRKSSLLESRENELRKLTDQLNELENKADATCSQLASKKNELRKLTDQLNELENQANEKDSQLKSKENELKRLTKQLNELENKVNQNGSQSSAKENELKKSKIQITELEKKINEKSSQLTAKETELKTLMAQLNQLEIKMNQKDSQLSSKEEELKAINEKLHNDIKIARQQTASRDKRISDLQTKVQDLENDLSLMKKTHNDSKSVANTQLESKVKMIKTLESDLKLAQEKCSNIERELKEREDKYRLSESNLGDENIKLNEKISNLTTENSHLKRKLSDESTAVSHLKENYERRLSSMRKEIEEYKTGAEKSESEVEELRIRITENSAKVSEKRSMELKQKEQQINELNNNLKEQNNEINSLKNIIEKYKKDFNQSKAAQSNIQRDLNVQILNLESKLIESEDELRSLRDSQRTEIENWKRKYNDLSLENDRLLAEKTSASDKEHEVSVLNRKLDELDKEKWNLQESKEKYKRELQKLITANDRLRREKEELNENSNNIRIMEEKMTRIKKNYLGEITSLQEENRRLEERLILNERRKDDNSIMKLNDTVSYYKLKYHSEVRHNNDLRVINDYLNKVLALSTRRLRSDTRKGEHSLNISIPEDDELDRDYYNSHIYTRYHDYDYPLRFHSHRRGPYFERRLNFKSVALLVLACVRMKKIAFYRRSDDVRLRTLRDKLESNNGRISW
ncbi:hypothetical protein SUVZ_02G4680 [Saccharomyces uvarum]|uniref:Spindle pole body component 110 n=1 Tax=Saccharomyces uvarum TaxID=230603 RepID=A0ABN8WSR0_SACUV|nr:hypothetical protein SUVZ_02G4680 [Saccharomyces uvarum]